MKHTGRIIALCIMAIRIIGWVLVLWIKNKIFYTNWFLLFIPETVIAIWIGNRFDQVNYYSQRDALTGVHNRRFIDAVFPKLASKAERAGTKISVFMVDMNDLKTINDAYGHKAGDTSIQHVSHVLVNCIRRCDFVARWGGDEFVIVAPDTDRTQASIMLDRLKKNMISVRIDDKLNLKPDISIGTSIYPDDGQTLQNLVVKADAAMYDDKASGSFI